MVENWRGSKSVPGHPELCQGKTEGSRPCQTSSHQLAERGVLRVRVHESLTAIPLEFPLTHGRVPPPPEVPTAKQLNTNFSLLGNRSIQGHPETALMGGVPREMGVLVAKHRWGTVGGSVRRSAPARPGFRQETENERKTETKNTATHSLFAAPATCGPPRCRERAGAAFPALGSKSSELPAGPDPFFSALASPLCCPRLHPPLEATPQFVLGSASSQQIPPKPARGHAPF